MPSERQAAPATIEADDIIAMNGLPDCDGRSPLDPCFGRRSTEADEYLMHGRDQHPELVGPDLVSGNGKATTVLFGAKSRRWSAPI
jgi:hypothetical protein